jgi:hypothetical protein
MFNDDRLEKLPFPAGGHTPRRPGCTPGPPAFPLAREPGPAAEPMTLPPGPRLRQEFLCPEDGQTAIRLLAITGVRRVTTLYKVTLREPGSERPVREAYLFPHDVQDHQFCNAVFPPSGRAGRGRRSAFPVALPLGPAGPHFIRGRPGQAKRVKTRFSPEAGHRPTPATRLRRLFCSLDRCDRKMFR